MRFRTLTLSVAAFGLLAACGDAKVISSSSTAAKPAGSSPGSGSTPGAGVVVPSDTVVVNSTPDSTPAPQPTNAPLPKPKVQIPATLPTTLVITDLTEGTGPAAAEGDSVIVHYIGVRSADGTEFDNSFDRGTPFPVAPLGTASVIDGWNKGLIGVKQGGRRQLDIPAALAYGDKPQGNIIKAGDALTFVIDVVAVISKANPADAPNISIPATPNQTTLTSTELIVGTGAEIKPGQTVAVQLIAYSAADGKLLDSTWKSGTPVEFMPGSPQSLPFLEKAVAGMKVGGRRQVDIPFAEAFDGKGNSSLGLPASTDLILVLDLVAVF
jgi:FKBP-type peptidyl-prolyl cis-trans isomerase